MDRISDITLYEPGQRQAQDKKAKAKTDIMQEEANSKIHCRQQPIQRCPQEFYCTKKSSFSVYSLDAATFYGPELASINNDFTNHACRPTSKTKKNAHFQKLM